MRRVLIFLGLLTLVQSLAAEHNKVTRAYAGPDQNVHIVRSDGREVVVPPEYGQAGIENIRIADDGQTVGWLVERWDSCCVSYPIPTMLVIWRSGAIIQHFHPAQAIFGWTFLKQGEQVAFHIAPLHGSENYTCIRVDLKTAKELEQWRMGKTPVPPDWVKLLDKQFPMSQTEDDAPATTN